MKRTPDLNYTPDCGIEFQKKLVAWFHQEQLHEVMNLTNVRGYQYARALIERNPALLGAGEYRCEALYCKYIFDPLGQVSVCEEACAHQTGIIGTYEEGLKLGKSDWLERKASDLENCRECSLRHACCGGCAWETWARLGTVRQGSCSGFPELLEYSLRLLTV